MKEAALDLANKVNLHRLAVRLTYDGLALSGSSFSKTFSCLTPKKDLTTVETKGEGTCW